MPEPLVADEILARELVIVDSEGRVRILLSTTAGDGCAQVIVTDEEGAFVSMNASDSMLGMHVDDLRQSCELNVSGIDVSVAGTGARLAEMEERVERVNRMVERLADERDDD